MGDFAAWMKAMGFNGKQVTEAGARLGIERDTTSRINREERQLTETERLAMAAVRAGLPAWTPVTDAEIADVKSMREILERAASRQASSGDASGEPKAA